MEELVAEAKKGDKDAFTQLILNIEDDLYKIARTRLNDQEDILDVIQETIISAYKSINKLKKNPTELEVLGDGTQIKPYLYVKDLVEAILLVWKKTNNKINYFNLGVETRTTVSEMAAMVIEEMKLDAKIKYTGGSRGWIGDVPQFSYSLDKIHNLGWSAKITSNEAIRKSIQYILENDLCKQ